jgi:hypothetical protein
VGFRLFDVQDSPDELPIAVEAALPLPDWDAR